MSTGSVPEGDRAEDRGQEIQRVEVETRPPTTDLVATLEASLGWKELAKVSPGKSKREPVSEKRPARRKRAS
jgi:hypothetical protein